MNCSKCGAALAGAAFCAACGTPANVVASNPAPAAPTDFQVPPMPYGAPAAKTNGMAIAGVIIGGLTVLAVIYLFAMFSAVSIGGPDGF